MTTVTTPVTFPITVPGAEQAGARLSALRGNLKLVDDQYKNLNRSAQGALAGVGAFAQALAPLEGSLGKVGSALSRAGGAVGQFSAFLGLGPAGLVAGGLIAGVGLLTNYLQDNERAAQEAADALKKAGDAAEKSAEQFYEAQRKQREALETFNKTTANQIVGRPAAFQRVPLSAQQQAELAALEADIKSAEENPLVGIGPNIEGKKNTGPALGSQAREAENELRIKRLNELEASSKERSKRLLGEGGESAAEFAGEKERAGVSKEFNQQKDAREYDKRKALREADLRHFNKSMDEMEHRYDALRGVGTQAFTTIGGNALTSLAQAAGSGKNMAKALKAAIGEALVADGTKNIFQGTGMILASMGTNPFGYALAGLGVAEVGIGSAMGGGSGGGAPSASAGGGGGARYGVAQRPAGYEPAPTNNTEAAAPKTVVNINYSTQMAAQPEDGVRAYRAMEAASRNGLIPPVRRAS